MTINSAPGDVPGAPQRSIPEGYDPPPLTGEQGDFPIPDRRYVQLPNLGSPGIAPPYPGTNQPHYAPPQGNYYAPPGAVGYGQFPYMMNPYSQFALSTFLGGNPVAPQPVYAPDSAAALSQPLYGANPFQALSRFFRKFLVFSGRASRSEFWWTVAVFALGYIAAFTLVVIFSPHSDAAAGDTYAGIVGLVWVVSTLVLLLPWIALTVRRLHDADMSGGLYFLNLVPYVGSTVVLIMCIMPSKPNGARFDDHLVLATAAGDPSKVNSGY